MLGRRTLLLMIPAMVLTYGLAASLGRTAPSPDAQAWVGEHVRRISPEEGRQLAAALRALFGQAEGVVVPDALRAGEKPLLFDQLAAVDYGFLMDEYRLPSGRLIWDRYNAHLGVDAIVVPEETSGSVAVAAAALLTHLCPKAGVNESFTTANGVTYQEHFRCELDYSLAIFYGNGMASDPDLNADLTKWARACMDTRPRVVQPNRRLLLKSFVRILRNGSHSAVGR